MPEKEEHIFVLKPTDKNIMGVFTECVNLIRAMAKEMPIQVIIKPYKFKRTLLANAYLHGWVFRKQLMEKLNEAGICIQVPDVDEATGEQKLKDVEWTVESLKVFFKGDFIIEQVVEIPRFSINGIEYREEVHPSNFGRNEFWQYCDLIAYYASVLWGIEVEPPTRGKFYTYWQELQK